jgi:hypothetical protein
MRPPQQLQGDSHLPRVDCHALSGLGTTIGLPRASAVMDIFLAHGAMAYSGVTGRQERVPALRTAVRELDTVFNLCPVQCLPPVIPHELAEIQESCLEPTPRAIARRQAVQLALHAEVFGSAKGIRITALLQPMLVRNKHKSLNNITNAACSLRNFADIHPDVGRRHQVSGAADR